MKKLGIAVVLAGLFVVGCGDSGLVKLENKNPTIDQKKYDLYVQALKESNYAKEYELSHIDILTNEYEPIMTKCKSVGDIFCNKNILTISKDKMINEMQENNTLIIFAINKKNKGDLRFIEVSCKKQELLSNLGKKGVKNALSYCIRNSENSFAINENGELVTTKEILQEWGKDFSNNENSKEAWHLCFSIKERATQQNLEKLQASVSEVMQQKFFGYKYAMILHTHQNNPHIHIIANKRNFLTNKKIHFKNKGNIKEFFSDIRDDFAYSLRARGLNYENKSALEKNLQDSYQRKKEKMDTLQTDFREFFKSYYNEYDFVIKNNKDLENKREKIAKFIKENENLHKQKSNLIDLLVQYTEQKNKKKYQVLKEIKKINQALREQKFTIARELKELNLLEKQQTNFKHMQIKALYGTAHNVFIQKDFIKHYENLYPNHKGASKTQIKEYFLVKSAIEKQTKAIETNYRKVMKENDLDFLKTYNPVLKTNAFKLAKSYKELEKNIYLLQNSPLESYEIKSYIENLQKNQKFIQKLMNNRSLELEKQIKEKMHKDSRIQHLETRSKSDNFLINEYSLTCKFLQKESFIKLRPRDLQTNASGANTQTQRKEAEQEQRAKELKKIEVFRKMQGREI